MVLKLNFSTCPNDTFMFGALVNKKIDSREYLFDIHLADIETLNKLAEEDLPDITKLSYGAFPFVASNYQLLNAGSALGKGVGPIVVSRHKIYPDEIPFVRVALPGNRTTAHLLFNLAFPNTQQKKFYLFSDIMEVVLSNEVDAGVIIHESRFTYEQRGLRKVTDLGDFWEKRTGLPTPLGGIAIKRSLPNNVKQSIDHILHDSIAFALKKPKEILPYVKQYAQEMDTDVMLKHIELYVNKYSLSIGEQGKNAVTEMFRASGVIPKDFDVSNIFIG